jgi:hypothetical protein
VIPCPCGCDVLLNVARLGCLVSRVEHLEQGCRVKAWEKAMGCPSMKTSQVRSLLLTPGELSVAPRENDKLMGERKRKVVQQQKLSQPSKRRSQGRRGTLLVVVARTQAGSGQDGLPSRDLHAGRMRVMGPCEPIGRPLGDRTPRWRALCGRVWSGSRAKAGMLSRPWCF